MPFDGTRYGAIAAVRAILGANGEHWIKGRGNDGAGNYCIMGAIVHYADAVEPRNHMRKRELIDRLRDLVYRALEKLRYIKVIENFNDSRGTDWAKVERVLAKAQELEREAV